MRPEIVHWWEQAEEDLTTARYNADGARLYAAAIFSHQTVEKALQALYMARHRDSPPSTHSLPVLGRHVGAPPSCARSCGSSPQSTSSPDIPTRLTKSRPGSTTGR